jgi:N-acetylglutamate synthase-like GNAT family acetyltransferase
MKPGKRTLGSASCLIRYSQLVDASKRGKLRELCHLKSERRGDGNGTKLLENVCAEADAAGVVLLLTAENKTLGRWYHKHGFRAIQEQPLVMMR